MTAFASKGIEFEINLTIPTLIACIVSFLYITFIKKSLPNTRFVRSVVLVLSYTCLISYFHPETILSRSTYWILLIPLFIFIMVIKYINNEFTTKVVLYSSLTIMILLAISYFKNYSILLSSVINTTEIVTNTSYFILYFLPFILCLKDNLFKKILLFLVLCIVILSAKRGAFISLTLALIIYYLIISKFRTNSQVSYLLLLGVFSIVLVFLVICFTNNTDLYVVERILSIGDDGGSGRTDIWKQVLEQISRSSFTELLFGHGYDSVIKIKEIGFSAHNDFLEVVYDFGIIAFILYICLHLNLIIYISRLFKYRSEYTASFAVSYVLFLTSSLVAHTYIYIYYMSIFCLFWAFVYASNKLTYK